MAKCFHFTGEKIKAQWHHQATQQGLLPNTEPGENSSFREIVLGKNLIPTQTDLKSPNSPLKIFSKKADLVFSALSEFPQ